MTTHLKPKYEDFCRFYLANHNAAAAARNVGYSVDNAHQQGHRLLRRPAILRRLAELRAALVERECRTPDALLAKLEAAFAAALKKDQPAAAARIVESQAKLNCQSAPAGAGTAADAADLHAAMAAIRAALAAMAKQLGLAVPQFETTGIEHRSRQGR